jgi:hypothetical protein
MRLVYIFSLVAVGLVLWLVDFSLAQSLYLAAAAGILIALLSSIFPRIRVFDRWWNLAPIVGLLLAALAYDCGYGLMVAVAVFVSGAGIYGFCMMRTNATDRSSNV